MKDNKQLFNKDVQCSFSLTEKLNHFRFGSYVKQEFVFQKRKKKLKKKICFGGGEKVKRARSGCLAEQPISLCVFFYFLNKTQNYLNLI